MLHAETALDLTARLASIASLAATLEMWAARIEFATPGAFGHQGTMTLTGGRPGRLSERSISALLIAQAIAAVVVALAGPLTAAGSVALALLVGARAVVHARRVLGGDGAEQITTLTLAATLLAVLPAPSEMRVVCAVAFIAAQLVLAYTTAGIAKLASPAWRGGTALVHIMRTEGWGHPGMAALLGRHPRLATVLGWSVVLFESGFLLFLIGPPEVALIGLAVGLSFHVGCAVSMGLNNFLLAFPATFPCVLVGSAWLSPFW